MRPCPSRNWFEECFSIAMRFIPPNYTPIVLICSCDRRGMLQACLDEYDLTEVPSYDKPIPGNENRKEKVKDLYWHTVFTDLRNRRIL
jgi:hypothetical protein